MPFRHFLLKPFLFLLIPIFFSACSTNEQKTPEPEKSAASPTKPAVVTQAPVKVTPPPQRSTPAKPRYPVIKQPVGGKSFMGDPKLNAFIDRMVTKHGFNRTHLINVFSKVRHRSWIEKYMNRPKPKSTTKGAGWSKYRAKFVKESKIRNGIRFWNQNRATLQRAARQYGVPEEYIVSIIGIETNYGTNFGKYRVIDALTTIALTNKRRSKSFFKQLESFLVMTRRERMNPLHPVGSHAGAMGYGQFMPSSFLSYAVDFDGNGVRDLWNPTDAIGSVANYFKKHGWKTGETVTARAKTSSTRYKKLKSGFKTNYSFSKLAAYGVTPSYTARRSGRISLLTLPTYSGTEVWLGYNNFYTISRYNHSTYYSMAVHQLAQALGKRMGR